MVNGARRHFVAPCNVVVYFTGKCNLLWWHFVVLMWGPALRPRVHSLTLQNQPPPHRRPRVHSHRRTNRRPITGKDLEYSKIRDFVQAETQTIDWPNLRKALQARDVDAHHATWTHPNPDHAP